MSLLPSRGVTPLGSAWAETTGVVSNGPMDMSTIRTTMDRARGRWPCDEEVTALYHGLGRIFPLFERKPLMSEQCSFRFVVSGEVKPHVLRCCFGLKSCGESLLVRTTIKPRLSALTLGIALSTSKKDELLRKEALEYHEAEPQGKIKVVPTKPHATAHELSLAYSPGVAYPCLEIEERPEDAYRYTSKGNLVAVISNGTAVLGLGNIGALASKPVMEGKGLLLKTFAGIDVFDIEVDTEDPEEFINTVVNISKTFGGINLEDIKAPECFEIERRIAEATDIPVMHDDQHGTAIISAAALLNAAELQEKALGDLKVVVIGAGASAIACANHYVAIGVSMANITLVDSQGIITKKRLEAGELNEYKAPFAQDRPAGDLADALKGADVLLGLSRGGLVTKDMVASMGAKPIIFRFGQPHA